MIKFIGKPNEIESVACSGGVDSMALLHFLTNAGHKPKALFFDHKTQTSKDAFDFVNNFCENNDIELVVGKLTRNKDKKESQEEYWRNERYEFFSKHGLVATAHHADDAAESWVFGMVNGCNPKIIHHKIRNVIRPLLLTKKSDLVNWCKSKNVPWIEDKTNKDTKYTRNFIRHKLIPEILKINPGFNKVVRKHYKQIIKN